MHDPAPDAEAPTEASDEDRSAAPRPPDVNPWRAVLGLGLPPAWTAAGFLLPNGPAVWAAVFGGLLATALLLWSDARKLGPVDRRGRDDHTGPAALLAGVLLLWVVVYPLAYFRRAAFAGPDLRVPAALVTLLCGVLPLGLTVAAAFGYRPFPPSLPAADGPEVRAVLEQIWEAANPPDAPGGAVSVVAVRAAPAGGAGPRRGVVEVVFAGGRAEYPFTVAWRDRAAGTWEVRVEEPEGAGAAN